MIIASFVLNELDSTPTKEGQYPVFQLTLNNLWKSTGTFLVLVDRGNPFGSKLIIQARDFILSKGNARVVAPCPHSDTCPMVGSWCHFSQKVQLPREMMEAMKYKRNATDCRFSFVILQKISEKNLIQEILPQSWPRIIVGPNKLKKRIVLDLCSPEGRL